MGSQQGGILSYCCGLPVSPSIRHVLLDGLHHWYIPVHTKRLALGIPRERFSASATSAFSTCGPDFQRHSLHTAQLGGGPSRWIPLPLSGLSSPHLQTPLPAAFLPSGYISRSYGGSVDLIRGFTKLPKGVGDRIYFSFSSVINGRARDKLLERLRAVPLERLLVESDQNSPAGVDPGLRAILEAVAEARGITVEEAAVATTNNFREFYGTCIERMEAVRTAVASDSRDGAAAAR
ncbi:hypothetical protein Vretimale_5797 [Volvox reticuliferus]|uniref:TatD related DNase n=1 Tax=Volvox reticuliferus TaxID=1737510 RepID=A0A8J4G690_9CHLO|nr:hypothetical protein Vretifemale_5701 [Volvox reticuliferus]GIM00905.1 hypothetical protein Vretimale_5797 [Volvox reticuliferus]